ncbi:hypothetical protein AB832_05310 [Flavobacteriaceae bacterium (ex Bugula neritina AB1)]|nr:hypothetical protein AB832_05310 [Flavobacteriaceae bacterium (ex Bugula neritina AB1)]
MGITATAATIHVNRDAIREKINQVSFNLHTGTSLTPGGFTPVESGGLEIETFPAYSAAARQEIMEGFTPVIENTGGFRGGMDRIPLELQSPNIESIPEFSDEIFGSLMLAITGSVTAQQAGEFIATELGAQSEENIRNIANKINSGDPWDKYELEQQDIVTVIVGGSTFVLDGHNRLSGLVLKNEEGATLDNINNISIEEAFEQYGDLMEQILNGDFDKTIREGVEDLKE